MAGVCFIQEAGEASQTFRFEDDRLVVAQADSRSASEFAFRYLDLDLETPREAPPRGLRAALSALARPARRIHARFALFEPRRGREAIAIWADAQAQDIVAQLSMRWREARRRAVAVDFAANPRDEIKRFQTLLARGIVSAEECAVAMARIAANTRAASPQ